MSTINTTIMNTLAPLRAKHTIDIQYGGYTGSKDKYIMFGVYNEVDTDVADDNNQSITYYIQMKYYYKRPQDMAIYTEIKELMKANGFIFDGASDVPYEADVYGKEMDFIYKQWL